MPSSIVQEDLSRAFERAWKQLTPAEQAMFKSTNSIDDVYNEAKIIQEKQAKKREMKAMERIRPYIEGLNRYAETISVFTNTKPELLCLIWGPIKFILTVASNHIDTMDKIISIFESIGKALPAFKRTERIFEHDEFCGYIAVFYKEILDFHIALMKISKHGCVKLVFDAVWPRHLGIFQTIRENIERHKETFGQSINVFNLEQCQKALRILEESRCEKASRRLEVDLAPFDYNKRLRSKKKESFPGMGKWVFSHNLLKGWMDTKNHSGAIDRITWIAGIPGAGKTHTCLLIVEYLKKSLRANQNGVVLYAFPTYDDEDGNTYLAVIRSIIYQLCLVDAILSEVARLEIEEMKQQFLPDDRSWGRVVLRKLIEMAGFPCFVILDGLDECDAIERKSITKDFLEIAENCDNLRILFSSRPEADMKRILAEIPLILVEEHNGDDISNFVNSGTSKLLERLRKQAVLDIEVENIIKGISRSLIRDAQGLFLFVSLVLKHIRNQPTIQKILDEANNLPENLSQTYDRIISQILEKRHSYDETKKVLLWLVGARRPMKQIEIEHAVAITVGDVTIDRRKMLLHSIIDLCGCLVKKVDEYIIFIHFSVREFLITSTTKLGHPLIAVEDSHLSIATTCIAFLKMSYYNLQATDTEIDQWLYSSSYVLHEYVMTYWFFHVRRSLVSNKEKQTNFLDLLQDFIEQRCNSAYVSQGREVSVTQEICDLKDTRKKLYTELRNISTFLWREQFSSMSSEYRKPGPLTLTEMSARVQERLEVLSEDSSNNSLSTNQLNCYGSHIFRCYLSSCIHHRIGFTNRNDRSQHMIRHERPYKCEVLDCEFLTLGFNSEGELKQHIAKSHATPHYGQIQCNWDGMDDQVTTRCLRAAAKKGDCGLLSCLIPATSKIDNFGWHELLLATAEGGSIEAFKIVNSNSNHKICPTSIEYLRATVQYSEDDSLARYLVEEGAPLNGATQMKHGKGFSALHIAIARGWETFIVYILGRGANADYEGGKHVSGLGRVCKPLHAAVLRKSIPIIQILLDYGVKIDSPTLHHKTALHFAVEIGSLSITEFLLMHGAQNLPGGKVSGTAPTMPFHHAIYNGRLDIVELFLDKNVDIEKRSHNVDHQGGCNAIHYAIHSKNISLEILKKLMEAGASLTADLSCKLASRGHVEAIRMLYGEFKADFQACTEYGATPLHHSSSEAVRVLCEFKANVEACDKDGKTPLHYLAQNRYTEGIRILCGEFKANVEACDKDGKTSLHYLAQFGYVEIHIFRGEFKANAEACDKHGKTPLAQNRYTEGIRILCGEFKANVEACDKDGKTPLHYLAQFGYVEVHIFRGEFKANAEACDKHGKTPLAQNRYTEGIRILCGEFKANVEACDKDGKTPLHYLVQSRYTCTENIRILCGEFKANVEACDKDGKTPLHYLAQFDYPAQSGYIEGIRILCGEFKANVEARDKDGATPLHIAVEHRNHQCMEVLCNTYNADRNARDNKGQTPNGIAPSLGINL